LSDLDDLAELMGEAPGGENFGRQRTEGSWKRLDRAAHEFAESGFKYFLDVEIHGTTATYRAGCRCASCKRAHRDYRRSVRRKK
jgi:hypothetical protein